MNLSMLQERWGSCACNGLDASQYRLPVEIGNYNEWQEERGRKYTAFYLHLEDMTLLAKAPILLPSRFESNTET